MMKDNKPLDRAPGPPGKHGQGIEPDKSVDKASADQPGKRFFTDFEDDDDYEESDRDNTYASAYQIEEPDDEPDDGTGDDRLADLLQKTPPEKSMRWQLTDADEQWSESEDGDENSDSWTELETSPESADNDLAMPWQDAAPLLAESAELERMEDEYAEDDDEDDWSDEDSQDYEDSAHGWPLGLIAVAVVALLLLGAGGYGVMQQRSAMEEEIRQLQASLATAASPAEVAASREALQEMEQRSVDQAAVIDALTLENRRLVDTVAGLELQLEAQQEVVVKTKTPGPAAPQPATPKPAASGAEQIAGAEGEWFVNFGTYSGRAMAESWAARLQPGAGRVVVATAEKAGASIYRVRVTGLTSLEQAEGISRQLEAEYGLPKLWVGKQRK